MTRVQKTTRPPSVWPEVWTAMSRKQRNNEIRKWNERCGNIDAARKRRGLDPQDAAVLAATTETTTAAIPAAIADANVEFAPLATLSCPVMPTLPTSCDDIAQVVEPHRERHSHHFSADFPHWSRDLYPFGKLLAFQPRKLL